MTHTKREISPFKVTHVTYIITHVLWVSAVHK